jgi:hypothetical protein
MSGSNASSPPPTERAGWFNGLPKWIAGSVALTALLFIPAGMLELLISGTYVPSHEWLEASRPAVYALWMVWGVAVFVILVRSYTDASKGAVYAVVAIAFFFRPDRKPGSSQYPRPDSERIRRRCSARVQGRPSRPPWKQTLPYPGRAGRTSFHDEALRRRR